MPKITVIEEGYIYVNQYTLKEALKQIQDAINTYGEDARIVGADEYHNLELRVTREETRDELLSLDC